MKLKPSGWSYVNFFEKMKKSLSFLSWIVPCFDDEWIDLRSDETFVKYHSSPMYHLNNGHFTFLQQFNFLSYCVVVHCMFKFFENFWLFVNHSIKLFVSLSVFSFFSSCPIMKDWLLFTFFNLWKKLKKLFLKQVVNLSCLL